MKISPKILEEKNFVVKLTQRLSLISKSFFLRSSLILLEILLVMPQLFVQFVQARLYHVRLTSLTQLKEIPELWDYILRSHGSLPKKLYGQILNGSIVTINSKQNSTKQS